MIWMGNSWRHRWSAIFFGSLLQTYDVDGTTASPLMVSRGDSPQNQRISGRWRIEIQPDFSGAEMVETLYYGHVFFFVRWETTGFSKFRDAPFLLADLIFAPASSDIKVWLSRMGGSSLRQFYLWKMKMRMWGPQRWCERWLTDSPQ